MQQRVPQHESSASKRFRSAGEGREDSPRYSPHTLSKRFLINYDTSDNREGAGASLKCDVTSEILFERVRSWKRKNKKERKKKKERKRKGANGTTYESDSSAAATDAGAWPVGTPEYRSRFTMQTESNCEATIHTVAHSIATGGVSCRTII